MSCPKSEYRNQGPGKTQSPSSGPLFPLFRPPPGPPPARLFLSPGSHPGWPGCPVGWEGQDPEEGLVEQ